MKDVPKRGQLVRMPGRGPEVGTVVGSKAMVLRGRRVIGVQFDDIDFVSSCPIDELEEVES